MVRVGDIVDWAYDEVTVPGGPRVKGYKPAIVIAVHPGNVLDLKVFNEAGPDGRSLQTGYSAEHVHQTYRLRDEDPPSEAQSAAVAQPAHARPAVITDRVVHVDFTMRRRVA